VRMPGRVGKRRPRKGQDEASVRACSGASAFGGDLLAVAVDAHLAGCASKTRRGIALVAEVAVRSADLVITRNGRDGLAEIERGEAAAHHVVWRCARDVTVVVQADGAHGAKVLHAILVADERGRLFGNAAVFDPHVTGRTRAQWAPRHARTGHAHFIRTAAIVRDRARFDGKRADAERRVAGITAIAVGVIRARVRALAGDALVARWALGLVRTLIGRRSADATHACVTATQARAVGIFAARRGVCRDAPIDGAGIPEDAPDGGTLSLLARAIGSAGFSGGAVGRIAAIKGHTATRTAGRTRTGRTPRTRTAGRTRAARAARATRTARTARSKLATRSEILIHDTGRIGGTSPDRAVTGMALIVLTACFVELTFGGAGTSVGREAIAELTVRIQRIGFFVVDGATREQ
jgi:hypothetical protein